MAIAVWPSAAGCFYQQGSPLPADFGACASPAGSAAPGPTWYRDVEPIVIAKCQGCHTDGGIAPFPLGGYEEVTALRGTIRDAVATRTMPPLQPDPCCSTSAPRGRRPGTRCPMTRGCFTPASCWSGRVDRLARFVN
jgi:hypothetical protein